MKLLLQRVRPDEPFQQPIRTFEHYTLHLSRPIILRPGCVGQAVTNVALAVPPQTLAIVRPAIELVHKHGLYIPSQTLGYFDTDEVTTPVRNLTGKSITLKSGVALLEMELVSGAQVGPAEMELVRCLPSR